VAASLCSYLGAVGRSSLLSCMATASRTPGFRSKPNLVAGVSSFTQAASLLLPAQLKLVCFDWALANRQAGAGPGWSGGPCDKGEDTRGA
jgi:hypothetical protein